MSNWADLLKKHIDKPFEYPKNDTNQFTVVDAPVDFDDLLEEIDEIIKENKDED